MYKVDLALNNLQGLICYKTQLNQTYALPRRHIGALKSLSKNDIIITHSDKYADLSL